VKRHNRSVGGAAAIPDPPVDWTAADLLADVVLAAMEAPA